MRHELSDLALEIRDRVERAVSDRLLSNQCEPALELVEPGAVGRREVQVKARPAREPGFDLGVLVCAVVVALSDARPGAAHIGFDVSQECEKLLMSMPRLALGQHRAIGHIQRRKQRRAAVVDVVMGNPLHVPEPHRQHWLGTLERLDLALLVDTQHQGVLWRIQIQLDDVEHLFDEERVVGELEALRAVRLQAEHRQITVHGALGESGFLSETASRPMRLALGLSGERRVDQRCDLLLARRAGPSRLQLIVQSRDAVLGIAFASRGHRRATRAVAARHARIRFAIRQAQDHLRTTRQSRRRALRTSHRLQLCAIFGRHVKRSRGSPHLRVLLIQA